MAELLSFQSKRQRIVSFIRSRPVKARRSVSTYATIESHDVDAGIQQVAQFGFGDGLLVVVHMIVVHNVLISNLFHHDYAIAVSGDNGD